MSRFIQLHMLTAYPPANLNRDDQGSPKTAKMGGYDRLRVSSQCLKRAWRTSEIFEKAIAKGTRTKMVGVDAFEKLSNFQELNRTQREDISKNIAKVFGKLKANSNELETLAFVSEKEQENINSVIDGFKNGLKSAAEESDSLCLELYRSLSANYRDLINQAIDTIKDGSNTLAFIKTWDKELKKISKEYRSTEDRPYDYINKLIDNVSDWIEKITGDEKVRDDQLEMFFLADHSKLAKDISKKLSIGSLLTGKAAKETEYGELRYKGKIALCKGWKDQVDKWVTDVEASDNNDYLSEDNIEALSSTVLPVAITKSSILTNDNTNADIALFGRMLADSPNFKVEAACQVAHAISVHPIVIEDDYFTAVEEMNQYREDVGAAHIGETRFAAGLFYSYICINRDLLIRNLINDFNQEVDINDPKYNGERNLAIKAIRALTEAAVKVAPEGKQNSFASRAYASYVLAEKGDQQPRSLSVAYLKPINHRENEDFIIDAIGALKKQKDSFDRVYGDCADSRYELNVPKEQGGLAELLDFVGQ